MGLHGRETGETLSQYFCLFFLEYVKIKADSFCLIIIIKSKKYIKLIWQIVTLTLVR